MWNWFSPRREQLARNAPSSLRERLEDRILFDGVPDAPLATPDQPVDDPLAPAVEATPSSAAAATDLVQQHQRTDRTEVVFVDKRVGNYEELVSDLLSEDDLEVYFLDRNSDGLTQIEQALAGRSDIDALHILSHGEQGQLRLGSTLLTQESMQGAYAEQLQQIGAHLGEDSDILIYGCNFAEGAAGAAAAQTLATLTGADVAASVDDTGHTSRDANWSLELQIGLVETGVVISLPAQESWRGIMAADGDLQVELVAAPNFVVDSNKPETGPSAAFIGVQVTNTGTDTLENVFVYAGDFVGGNVGLYPVLSNPTFGSQSYAGDLSLVHEGGTADATRYIGDLAARETRVQYFLVSYPTTDDNGLSLAGASSDPGDDVVLPYDIWVTADDPIDGGLEAVANGQATLRSEISAMANKIWPNTDSKVPNEYLDAFQQQLGWRPDASAITPGAQVQLQGIWYDMGRVIGGYDADNDLLPDYDVWMQPVGDASVFDANSFRLVKSYGVLIVKLNDGTEQVIAFEDELYHKDLPANNTGVVGLVFYEFIATGSETQAVLSPYQEAASGSGNVKYNGDYGTSGGTLVANSPEVNFDKEAVDATTEAPITSIAISDTLEYVLQATNASATSALGLTTFGLPVVIEDEVPDGTIYVAGSAAADNSHTDVTILYSTDDGLTWTTTEPIAQPVTNIQWWLQSPLDPGEMLEVTFQTTVAAGFADAILENTGTVGLGSGNPLAEDTELTLIEGTSSITGVVFSDDGAGGATASDGVRGGTEGTLNNIDVSLYVDMDGDGAVTAADILWGTATTTGGSYTFTNLPDGDYLLQVAGLDPDRPTGWTLTTDGLAALTITGASLAAPDFGFGPVLDVDKELVGSGPIYEGDLVSYTIDVRNLLGDPWDETTGGFISYTTWGGAQHTTLATTTESVTNPANAFGTGPDGAYAEIEFSNNPRDTIGAGTFVIDSPLGNITSVELLVWGYGEATHVNDELTISAQTNSGALHQLGTITGTQIQSSTAPTLFTFNVTDADPVTPGIQSWQWSDFTALATATGIQIETLKNSGPDRTTFFVDAIGFRVITDQSVVGTGTPDNTLVQVPLIDDYDESALRFVSASITPTSVDTVNGVLTWSNIGTLLPGQGETITVTFEALEPAGNLPLSNVDNTATSTGATLGDGSPANSDTDTVLVDLQPTALIGDRVWLDHDNNQTQNGSEPGLSGVTVILRNSGGTEIDRTTTDANGDYEFRVAANGTYTVAIDTATLPGVMNSTTGGNSRAVTIASLTDNVSIDFGYRFTQPVVYGNTWHDVDGDGLTGNTTPEAGENGLSGVTVVLYDVGRSRVNATVTTDAYGNYYIPVAQSGNGGNATYVGNYEVRVTTAGMFATGTTVQTVDPDATRDNTHAVSITASDISSGDTLRGGFDFAYRNTGALTIGDQVFYDWDGDGTFDVGQDEGIANLTVELYEDANGDGVIDPVTDGLIAVTSTNANGNYQFGSLPAGDYIVRVDTADADYPTGTSALNGDAQEVALSASTTSVDFAYVPVGSAGITGTVWDDRNGDQTQSGTLETGLANVTVSLFADLNGDGTFTLVRSTTTNSSGDYTFTDLPAGDFRVVVDESDPDLETSSGAPRVLTTASGTLNISLGSGATSTGNDFGFAQLGSIGDTIFFDANRNGTFDDFETGIANVTVRLLYENGVLITTTVTSDGSDGNPIGYYQFANLAPGEYQVEVDVSTLPSDAGTNTADPDRDGVPSWDNTYPDIDALYPADNRDEGILIDYSVSYQGGDIGYEQTGVVGDTVWLDQNGDGVQQSGEVGLANVRVTATSGGTTLQTFTNGDGNYVLTGLSAGVWTITVDTGTLPYSPTVATTSGGDNSFTVTVDASGAVTHIDGVDVTGQTDPQLAVDFGYRLDGPFTISGTVVLEETGTTNGLAGDPTDTPVGGLTLFLFRSTGELLTTTTTAPDGSYSFNNLPADDGSYDYVVALSRNLPILENTQLTTTAALTPADSVTVIGNTVRQQLSIAGSVTGLDFAFESTVDYDYGDLPAAYSNTITDSPAGPRHILTGSGPYLGTLAPDAEPNAVESPNADSDLEDDGVTFVDVAQWADGANGGSLQVQVTGSGWLVGWIDFDGDGSFSDANELIVNQAVTTGSYDIDFEIPAGTIDGNAQDLFARFRLFTEEPLVPQLAFTGTATGGEVEDYRIALPQQTVTIGDAQITEGGDLIFDVTLASASRAMITLDLAATDVSATGGDDYELGNFEYSTDGTTWLPATGANGTIVTFTPGVSALQVRINTTDDVDSEPTETFTLSVAAKTGPAGDTTDTGTGSILDNDNSPPTTSNTAVTTVEDASHTFAASDFPYNDPDTDPLASIRITSLPTDGTLVYDGVIVTQTQIDAGLVILAVDIGKLQFTPDANENGTSYAAFGFTVSDGGAESAAATMTVHVTPVNDAPTLTLPGNQNAAAGTPLVLSGLSTGDIDAGSGDVTVTLSIAAGALNVNTAVAGGLTAGDVTGNGGSTVTLTGTIAEINTTLADANGLTYTHNTSGTRTLSVLVNDEGNTGVDPSTVGQPATGDADDERASGSFDITIPAPTLAVNSVTVTEGTDPHAVFTVSLSNPTATAVSFNLALADSTATGGGVDYGAANPANLQVFVAGSWVDATSATIPAGQTSVQVRTPITDDIAADSGETFTLTATVTGGVTANPSAVGTGTINDEAPGDTVLVSIAGPASVDEGDTTTDYTVSLTATALTDVTVTLSYSPGTAVAGTDYTAQTTVTIPAGSNSATFTLDTTEDSLAEGPEPFTVTITNVSGGGFENIAIDTANDDVTTTIQDDDVSNLSINNVTVTEGTDPHAVFTLSLSAPSTGPVTVALSLNDGTATIGDDTGTSAQLEYFDGVNWVTVPANGQVTIAAGETSLQVRTAIVDDALDEATEQFTLTAAYVSGALGSTDDVTGTGTILDNDPLPSLSINDVTRNEADGTMTFTASLSAASGRTVTVNYATTAGTAGSPGDYTQQSNTLMFNPGETTKSVTITLQNDNVAELTETFTVDLAAATNATISDASGTGTILDNDAAQLTINDVSQNEGDSGTTTYTFTVSLDRAVDTAVSVNWQTANGTTNGTDLAAQSGSVTFAAGETSKTFSISVNGDETIELDETFLVDLSGLSAGGRNVTIADDQGQGTIVNDDAAEISINDVSRNEGDSGTTSYTFTVTLDQAVDAPVSVNWATANGTTDGTDLAAQSGSVTFAAGETSKTFTVDINADQGVELDETFAVNLSGLAANGRDVTISDAQGQGTIVNDDDAQLSINDISQNEGDSGTTTYTFTVTLDQAVDAPVSVNWATANGTTDGTDLAAQTGSVTFAAGETSKTINVSVNGDQTIELNETFLVNLSGLSATGRSVTIADSQGQGTIVNDDAAQVSINDGSRSEGDTGTTAYTFTVTLDQPVDGPVSVNWATANDTTDGTDLAAQSGSVTFAAGETLKTLTVAVNGDGSVELDETFFVNLSGLSANGRNVSVADGQGDGTVVNDDAAEISINDVSQSEGDSGTTTYTFTVSLDQPVDVPVSVNWSTANGTSNGTDLAAQSGSVTFAAGETSKTFSVNVSGDQTVELDETFLVNLSGLSATGRNVTIADGQGQGTIVNDDAAEVSINDVSRDEGDSGTTSYTFTVTLDQAVDAPVSVNWATAHGTTNGTDLGAQSGSVTFAAGETSKTFTVNVNGDQTVELDETFVVNLSGLAANGRDVTISDAQGQGTIVNDDTAQLSINDVSQNEGDSGTTTYTFTVTLDQAVDGPVSVNWATANGTTDATDLAAQSGSVTFAAGETSKSFSVDVNGDRLVESNEVFLVNLSGLSSGGRSVTVADAQGQGTILNDDNPPTTANHTVTTDEDTDYTFQVSDFPYADADSDPMASIRVTSLPTDGTLLLNGTVVTQTMIDAGLTIPTADIGQLVFRPDADEFGNPYASFNFLVSDGVNPSTPAVMTINVNSVNDPPTARNNEYTTDEDQPVSGNIIVDNTGEGVDSDPDGGVLSVVDGDGNAANGLSPVSGPANGTVVLNSNGTFTYTPNSNFFGDDTFTYRITDGQGGFDTATVTIHVTPVNDDPLATNNTAEVTEDGPLTDTGNALTDDDGDGLDSDPESNPLHIASVTFGATTVTLPSDGSSTTINGQYGTLTIDRTGSYTYTLNNALAAVQQLDDTESLTDTFNYELSDGQGGDGTADLVVTINGVNDPPVADSGGITVQEGSTDNPLGLTAPTDPDDEPLTITVTGLPNFGSVTLADGTPVANGMPLTTAQLTGLLYDAPGVYDGSPVGAFTYSVTDGDATVTGSVAITVTRPVGVNDGNTTTAGDPLPVSGNVLGNDVDPENDPLIVTQVAFGGTSLPVPNDGSDVVINGTYGTLTIHDDGSYEYDLNDSHPNVVALNGAAILSETFTYDLADGNGGTDSADLVITIRGQNDPPVATDNTGFVTEDGPITDSGNVLVDNDGSGVDSDADLDSLSVSRIEFGASDIAVPATGSVSIDGAYGTLSIAADGSYTYTLNNTLPAVQQLSDGETLQEVFRYTATDSVDTDAADLTITIHGVNDDPAPVGAIPDQSDVDARTITPVDVSPFFSDVDLTDAQTFDDGGTLPPGLAIVPATGRITGTLPPDASQGGTGGAYSVTITVTDKHGQTATQTFTWTVTNPPPIATDNSGLVREDGPLTDTGNVITDNDGSGLDVDPDGDAVAVTAIDGVVVPAVGTVVVSGSYGTLTIAANGDYTYTLDNTLPAVQSLSLGETLGESFTYTLSDGEGGTDTALLSIVINGANDPPVAVDDTNTTDSDTPVNGQVLPNDSDPDADDVLSVVAVNGSNSGVGGTIMLPSGALLTLNSDGTYAYDPNGAFDHLAPGETTVDTFTYTVNDPHGETDTAVVVISILGLNDPPMAWDEIMHTPMDQPVTAHVLDNDTDPNGEPLCLVMIKGPEEGTAVARRDGTITFTPAPGFTGMVAIRYLAEDPHGASSAATLMIMVDPPEVDPPAPVPAFGFDSFNNFSQSRQVLAEQGGTYRQPLLTREIFTLAPEPTFSGYARPGTTVVGRIYDERGVLIGEGFAHADPGGNWMMQFQGVAKFEHYRIEFDYVVESQDIYGYLGLDPSDNSYQAMQPLTDWMEPLSVAGAIRQSPWHSLNALHRSLQRPLGFGSE